MTDSVYARAGINLVGREDQRREGREVAIANVQAGQGTKSAQSKAVAKPSGGISVASNSNDYGLAAGASSIGSFSISYSVPGLGEGIEIPLTFNFRVTGQLKAIEATTISSFAYQVEASGTNGTEIINGEATIGTGRGFEQKIESSSGFVSGAVQSPESSFSFSIPIEVEVGNTGSIQGSLLGNATAGGDSTIGNSTFDLSLNSITIPQSFTAIDVTGLEVEFSSGITKNVEVDYGKRGQFSEEQLAFIEDGADINSYFGFALAGIATVASLLSLPVTAAMAGLMGALCGGIGYYLNELSEEQPDSNYRTLAYPQSEDFMHNTNSDQSFSTSAQSIFTSLYEVLSLSAALDETLDKMNGAELFSDLAWFEQHETLASEYAQQLSINLNNLSDPLIEFAEDYRGSDLPQIAIDSDDLISFQSSLLEGGLPETTENYLQELGFNKNEMNEIYNQMVIENPYLLGTEPIGLSDFISSPELIGGFDAIASALSQGIMS
jgi:hypothetical protein